LIREYFYFPSENFIKFCEGLSDSSFGKKIHINNIDVSDLEEISSYDLAIFYLGNLKEVENLRKKIFSLEYGNWNLKLIDLGAFNQGHSESDSLFGIQEVIRKLTNLGVYTLMIGGSQSDMDIYCKSFKSNDYLDVVSIDKFLGIGESVDKNESSNYLSRIIFDENIKLSTFSNVGYLKHLNNIKKTSLVDKFNFETLSLGQLKYDINEIEPITRNSEIINFSIEALKSNVINYKLTSPNGIDSYEACVISKFIGQSIDCKIATINNIVHSIECYSIVSEMIWYIIDGFDSRYDDNFENHDEFNIYHIEIDGHNLKFLKSHISKRWWVEYVDDRIISIKNQLIPCSENDFKLSQMGIISDRILKRMKNKFV